MPIYEYLCERCGKVHEVFQKLNEKPPSSCDECGSRKLAKLVSRSAFQLKGGGWYSDLYASRKPAAGGSTSADSSGSGGADASPKAKPASTESAGASKESPAAKPKAATPAKRAVGD